VPPAIVSPGKKITQDIMKDAPIGSLCMCTDTGYFNSKTFIRYLDHFAANTNPTKEKPVLLILDGFRGHVNVETIQHAMILNIVVVCLPSHTTHVLQPMDVGIFSPFKNYYRKKHAGWCTKHLSQRLLKEDFCVSMTEAYYMMLFLPKI
jgi:hypothetical protein